MQMEALLEVLEPLLSIFASTDVVFSPKAGYTVLCVTPYTSEVLESKSINEPKEMAAYLLDSIKYDYCFSLGVNTLLSTDSFCSLEELEYAMPHYQKAVYSAVFKEVQDKISSILAQPPLRTPRFSLQEDPLLTVLYNFQRSLSLQQRLFSVPDKKIYQNYRKALLEAYCQKYGAVYLGKFPADGIGKMTYTKYKKTDEYDEYDFCIPYPDTDLLNLVNQWDTTNSAKKIPLYYKIQERVLSQKRSMDKLGKAKPQNIKKITYIKQEDSMSIITSILHCYGLLISEESVTLMQQYILPLWEKTKPELYEMFSTKSDNDEFFDYLLDHYAICYNGTADYLRCWRICDGEEIEPQIDDHFYFMDLLEKPSLFKKAYESFEDVIKECQQRLEGLLPPDFPYEDYLLEITGELWG